MWRRYELKKKRIKNGGRQGPQIRGVVEGIRAEREREREREGGSYARYGKEGGCVVLCVRVSAVGLLEALLVFQFLSLSIFLPF
jgi:hypothetical protein